ncbi:MAG: flagellar motor switch protein FliG [Opitutaceae bacterium]
MSAEFDYPKLNRQQKLAVFLIVIGPEAAAEVLRQFDDPEIEVLCREMSNLAVVPQSVHRQVLEEFSSVLAQSAGSTLGGVAYAQRTLEIAKGDYKASAIIGRVGGAPSASSMDVVKDISEMEARQIFNLIRHEQAQTVAFVLSYLDSSKSSQVFNLLPPELREEVLERLGTIESTSLELAGKIAQSLGKHMDRKAKPAFHHSGGVRVVADLLNRLDKEMSKGLLARLEERNATLSAEIRRKLFSFDDLIRLQPSDLQRVLREVDSANLVIAMKSASETLREKIYAGISKRAAESLREELGLLGPVKRKEVDAAQDGIIQVVRRLEEEGQVTLDTGAAAGLVA